MCASSYERHITRGRPGWVTPLRVTAILCVVTALIAVPGGCCGEEQTGRTQNDAWRSPDALHPIQAEMQPFVREMIDHAFDSYIKYAFPKDELCAVRGIGRNTMGGYGWTLIDSLDTLAVAGRHKDFRQYAKWVEEHVSFDLDVSVSVFETIIRALGGLLAAHFMYEEGVVEVVPEEHKYTGGLLRLATDLGDRLLPAFRTNTGISRRMLNLRTGACYDDIPSLADAGTMLLEMTALSRATGDDKYERAARRATEALFAARDSETNLMGLFISAATGKNIQYASHLGGGIDSVIEYFIKSHSMTGSPADWERFERSVRAVNRYIRKGGMLTSVHMRGGHRMGPLHHDSLASFFPGNLLLGGHHDESVESNWPIHSIFKHYGVIPETFHLNRGGAFLNGAEYYLLRPEHAESVYILYRATRDPVYLVMGRELALGINLRTRTQFGFSKLESVQHPHHDELHGDSMESFMIAETLKYLYLLFDECNVVHVQGKLEGSVPSYCDAKESTDMSSHVGWVFNTEAHLLPNTAEWWMRASGGEAEKTPEAVQEERLKVIDGLLQSLDDERGAGRSGGTRTGVDAVPHEYYCSNHAPSELARLSKSLFR